MNYSIYNPQNNKQIMQILDENRLLTMFQGKRDKVEILISALQTRIPEWQEEAEQSFSSNNLDDIRKLCHKIRGAAGTISAEKLENNVIELGNAIKNDEHLDLQSFKAGLYKRFTEIKNYKFTA